MVTTDFSLATVDGVGGELEELDDTSHSHESFGERRQHRLQAWRD